MKVNIESSWHEVLSEEFEKAYFQDLVHFVKSEYQSHQIYPPGKEIFAAFDYSPFTETKVIIIGQDPYHGEGQANGLCFSVKDHIRIPPSLLNIYKELQQDLNIPIPSTGNLEKWAKQGVLLLNATLTVRAKSPGSHQKMGWETFTDAVIQQLSDQKQDLVFILWGAYAQKKGAVIDRSKHLVIESAHPSPFAAHRGFFGSRPFSQTNEYLRSKQMDPVKW